MQVYVMHTIRHMPKCGTAAGPCGPPPMQPHAQHMAGTSAAVPVTQRQPLKPRHHIVFGAFTWQPTLHGLRSHTTVCLELRCRLLTAKGFTKGWSAHTLARVLLSSANRLTVRRARKSVSYSSLAMIIAGPLGTSFRGPFNACAPSNGALSGSQSCA